MTIEDIKDLTKYHSPVPLTVSTAVIKKQSKVTHKNRFTDWNKFLEEVDFRIGLKVRLKRPYEIELHRLIRGIKRTKSNSKQRSFSLESSVEN